MFSKRFTLFPSHVKFQAHSLYDDADDDDAEDEEEPVSPWM